MRLTYEAVPVVTVEVDVVELLKHKRCICVEEGNPTHATLVTVLAVIDRYEEQKGVAFFDLRTLTILTTPEHCSVACFLATSSASLIGELSTPWVARSTAAKKVWNRMMTVSSLRQISGKRLCVRNMGQWTVSFRMWILQYHQERSKE